MFQNIQIIFIGFRPDQKIQSCKLLIYVFQDTKCGDNNQWNLIIS